MAKFKGKSVKTQMLAAFFVVIAFLLVVSAVSLSKLVAIDGAISTTSDLLYVEHSKTKAIEKALTACDDQTFNLQDDISRFQGDGAANLSKALKDFEAAVNDTDAVKLDSDIISSIKQSAATYLSQAQDFTAALESGDKDKAADVYANGLSNTFDVIRKNIGLINDHQIQIATDNVTGLHPRGDMILVLVLTIVAVVLAVIIAVVFAGRITAIIDRITVAVARFGTGDLSSPVQITSKTEFGELERDLEKMRQDLIGIISLVIDNAHKITGSVTTIHDIAEKINSDSKDSQNRALTVAAASDEMVSTTADIAKNCEAAADNASKSSKITRGWSQIHRRHHRRDPEAGREVQGRRRGGLPPGRTGQQGLLHSRDHRRHRQPDQPAGAQRGHRGRPRRRGRQGLRGRRRRGARAGLQHLQVHPGDHQDGRLDAAGRQGGQRLDGRLA